ncbi:class III lanthionine synthetase LanKC [Streptomyces sp. NPDC052051]|uniref:class III lanthionine synthetase LanKC n=1 Tax=Streptomyces sp. NPDC052051 TaxID=3154649 RepID=UPI00343D05D4
MDENHQLFGWSDLVFYDTPHQWIDPAAEFAVTRRSLPEGWIRSAEDLWTVLRPEQVTPPAQGWKIHVSARAENAEQVLGIVWDYCTAHELPFKYLRDTNMHLVLNSKYSPRQSSGKLAALYPADDNECRVVLEALSPLLETEDGPYVLSDLRWGKGPLYVRYGGFRKRETLTEDGELVPAVERPDGALVQDHRKPVFSPPGWVRLPDFLKPHQEAARSGDADFGYRIEKALHFSNGGGVYLAERLSDGARLVLKEARPGAGLDRESRDAVVRLRRERDILTQLAGVGGVPAVEDYFTAWEHEFLAMEYLPGDPLLLWAGREHALLQPDPDEQDVARYTRDALRQLDRISQLLERIHEAGVFFGDLHPGNILVTESGDISFIDFETAFREAEQARPAMGAQGFAAPWLQSGRDMDRYALASLKLWFFLPVNRIFPLGPTKVAQTAAAVQERFPVPDDFTAGILRDMGVENGRNDQVSPALPPRLASVRRAVLGTPPDVDLETEQPDWPAVRRSLAAAIGSSATPLRMDRLYPGDARQFRYGPASFAYGAAGVLWALSATGHGRSAEHEEWLLSTVRGGLPPQPGFYTGMHGTAYALDHLGYGAEACSIVAAASALTDRVNGMSLFGGLAGVGLNALHFAQRYGMSEARRDTERVADRLAELIRTGRRPGAERRLGLMHGWSGPALFFIRLYEDTGDASHLDMARAALDRDLAGCVRHDNGTVQVLEVGRRTLAYMESGSAGIGLVADEFLVHRSDEQMNAAVRGISAACRTELVVEPHLFNGRAGLLATLARLSHRDPTFDARPAIRRHLRRFGWLALSYRGYLAFPGDQSLRLSMDLATGNAGVLLGITTALDTSTEFLPFFRSRPS